MFRKQNLWPCEEQPPLPALFSVCVCEQACPPVFFSAFVSLLISFFGLCAFLWICVARGRGGGRHKFPFYTII